MFRHALEHIQDILLLHEAHLTVDLRELRLAIRTQILVTETFYDLEITVETGNHQQLLQGLWRLRQSVELSRFIREGTTKSRAPSGVEFTRTGVSTSKKPCSSK